MIDGRCNWVSKKRALEEEKKVLKKIYFYIIQDYIIKKISIIYGFLSTNLNQ